LIGLVRRTVFMRPNADPCCSLEVVSWRVFTFSRRGSSFPVGARATHDSNRNIETSAEPPWHCGTTNGDPSCLSLRPLPKLERSTITYRQLLLPHSASTHEGLCTTRPNPPSVFLVPLFRFGSHVALGLLLFPRFGFLFRAHDTTSAVAIRAKRMGRVFDVRRPDPTHQPPHPCGISKLGIALPAVCTTPRKLNLSPTSSAIFFVGRRTSSWLSEPAAFCCCCKARRPRAPMMIR
jgi:hypothetical protein